LRSDLAASLPRPPFDKFSQFIIQAALGQVSFTMDLWSDQLFRPYLAMTAHWIAETEGGLTLELKSALIAFHRMRENHSGHKLAKTVMYLLDRAGVTVKVRQRCSSTDW
jgi:hypothetical protein